MKKFSLITALCLAGAVSQAQLVIDDFSGNLSAYTATRILKATPAAANNTYAWEISNGALRINTSTYGGIEQYALTRTDFPLSVGFELSATYSASDLGSQDLGLYVGAGAPTADVRANYVSIYMRNNGQLYSRGFNGTTELSLSGGSTPTGLLSLFVARTGVSTFDLGWYDGNGRNILASRTMTSTTIGDAIGFYGDVRALGLRGSMDNLTITAIPEPTAAALLGLGSLGLVFRLRRK
ncbi:MAG: PEP-CTERM sorting domain-containing protein [Verrucomicrobiota bacterium]